ncbi:MAG: hypothetical protein KKD44_13370, partial [Proteobacteria bacterium]|nr:hypothetical protein [Pseudomonadota bacterium]
RCPTLKALCYHIASKDSLPGGWPSFRDGILTRSITRPCPAALFACPLSFRFACPLFHIESG